MKPVVKYGLMVNCHSLFDEEPAEDKPRAVSPFYGYVADYERLIRRGSELDRKIALKQIKAMLAKGITGEQVTRAIQNYAKDPWRYAGGPRHSKNMRSFFSEAIIIEWQTAMPTRNPLEALTVTPAVMPTTDRFQKTPGEDFDAAI